MAKRFVKGYPPGIFQGGEVNRKYLCGMCHLVLRNPVQRFCGHRYCRDCVEIAKSNTASDFICQSCIAEGVDESELANEESDTRTVMGLFFKAN